MNSAELETFAARLQQFMADGMGLHEAERMADGLVIHDRVHGWKRAWMG